MYRILAFVFILSAHVANAAEIRGVVKLATRPEAYVQVAYESMTSDDRIHNMVGLNLDTEAASKSSDFCSATNSGEGFKLFKSSQSFTAKGIAMGDSVELSLTYSQASPECKI